MVGLASDVGKLGDFMADPQAAMAGAGLAKEDQDLLLSGDQGRIYSALKGLPLPPPMPAAGPLQLPTVVASQLGQNTAPGVYQHPGGAVMAQSPQAQGYAAPSSPQAPVYYVMVPQGYGQMPAYYVLQWPNWPTS